MEKKKRAYSEQEAYNKLSALCAMSELCCYDMQRKMRNWEMPEGARERVVEKLLKERFIDEARYAHAFVRDKFRYNHWGKVRIQQELRLRNIAQLLIDDALQENIPQEDNLSTLKDLIEKKRPTVKGRSQYEVKGKLIRFAVSKGFSIDDVMKVVGDLDKDE